jgi:hypothetical protein
VKCSRQFFITLHGSGSGLYSLFGSTHCLYQVNYQRSMPGKTFLCHSLLSTTLSGCGTRDLWPSGPKSREQHHIQTRDHSSQINDPVRAPSGGGLPQVFQLVECSLLMALLTAALFCLWRSFGEF